MHTPKILGAIGTLFIAGSSAAPYSISNNTNARRENSTDASQQVAYFQAGDAQWVSDTQLCGNDSRERSGYVNVNNKNGGTIRILSKAA